MERRMVKTFDKNNNLSFACSTPTCSWSFSIAVRQRRDTPPEDWPDFTSQATKSFGDHTCGNFQ